MKLENVRFDGKSAVRVVSIVVVMVVHFTALVFISLPATPLWRMRTGKLRTAGSDLVVRLVDVRAPTQNHAASTLTRQSVGRKAARHEIMQRTKPVKARVEPHAEVHANRRRTSPPLDLSLPDMGRGKAVVGRTLGHARAQPHWRLPGRGHVHGAPHIELIDPRVQGVAGVVRAFQGMLGGVDPHCVAVDGWRGMTREERFEQHVTQADIQHAVDEYGCVAPRRHQAMPGDPEPPWVFPGH